MDIKELSDKISALKLEADNFFDAAASDCGEDTDHSWMHRHESINAYWDKLPHETRSSSQVTQETLLNVISLIIPTLKSSPVLNQSDEKDVGRCVKRMRAALKLRNYRSWDIEVLHDEGDVLGVNPPGQSEDEPSTPSQSRKAFFECVEQLEGIVQLLKIAPSNIPNGLPSKNPNLSQL